MMIKKFFPAVLLAFTLIMNHGHAMDMGDVPVIQTLKGKMCPNLLGIYQKPKAERKAYIAQVCTDPEENDKLEIDECIDLIKKESKLDYFGVTSSIEMLNSQKSGSIELMNNQSNELKNAIVLKNQAEKNMKDFIIQAENHACLFAAPNSSAEQLVLVKQTFTKYLEDGYNLKNTDRTASAFKSTSEEDAQMKIKYNLYDSFLVNLGNIYKVDKYSFNSNEAIKNINKYEELYLIAKEKEKGALRQIDFSQSYINKYQNEINNFENKMKELQTPLYLFLEDLNSIQNIL